MTSKNLARKLVLRWGVAVLQTRGLDAIFDWTGDPLMLKDYEDAVKWAVKKVRMLEAQAQ